MATAYEEATADPHVVVLTDGVVMRPFHIPVDDQEWHVYCAEHPEFGFCGVEEQARKAALDHVRSDEHTNIASVIERIARWLDPDVFDETAHAEQRDAREMFDGDQKAQAFYDNLIRDRYVGGQERARDRARSLLGDTRIASYFKAVALETAAKQIEYKQHAESIRWQIGHSAAEHRKAYHGS